MKNKKSDLSRRKFISGSVGALAIAGLANAPGSKVWAANEPTPTTTKPALTRTLGRTGLVVPVVSMGAGACNDPGLVQASYEAGMRVFDTAATYAYGRNEQMVGTALDKAGVRDKSIIITKIHTPAQRDGVTPEESAKRMRDTLEGSLKRLKTDHVDILFIHDVRDAAPIEDETIKKTLLAFQKEGKARFLGVSTHSDMANVINATVAAKIYDVVLTSINFTMADDTDLLAAIANAASNKLGVIGMKTQAGGARFPNPETLRDYSNEVVNSAALKWALQNENIATTIPGIDNYDSLRKNIAVAGDLEFTEEEKNFLSDNSIKLGMGFCRQCSSCLASCPLDADIPTLMRTHMYATQYANFELARETLNEIPKTAGLSTCGSCSGCTAQCANTVNIGRKIQELSVIYA